MNLLDHNLLENIMAATGSFQPCSTGTENVNYKFLINHVNVFSIMSHYEKVQFQQLRIICVLREINFS